MAFKLGTLKKSDKRTQIIKIDDDILSKQTLIKYISFREYLCGLISNGLTMFPVVSNYVITCTNYGHCNEITKTTFEISLYGFVEKVDKKYNNNDIVDATFKHIMANKHLYPDLIKKSDLNHDDIDLDVYDTDSDDELDNRVWFEPGFAKISGKNGEVLLYKEDLMNIYLSVISNNNSKFVKLEEIDLICTLFYSSEHIQELTTSFTVNPNYKPNLYKIKSDSITKKEMPHDYRQAFLIESK